MPIKEIVSVKKFNGGRIERGVLNESSNSGQGGVWLITVSVLVQQGDLKKPLLLE